MKYYKNGELDDKKIIAALEEAATDYANGELLEVQSTLVEIVNAINAFSKSEEGA